MTPSYDETTPLRRWVYALLISVAVAGICGRILSIIRVYEPDLFRAEGEVDSPYGEWPKTRPQPMPTLGANDRSRWDTVRALVDDGTYVIGRHVVDEKTGKPKDLGIVAEDGWGTIDKVLKPGTDELYSSKPPFLPTLLAGEYWLLKKAFGWSITTDRNLVIRTVLLTFNVLPFLVYLWLLSRLLDRFGITDWGRVFLMTAACFGTLISPFLVSLNNHTLAACFALFAVYLTLRELPSSTLGANLQAATAGLFSSFAACNELPAASLVAGLLVVWVMRQSRPAALCFVLAAMIPAAGFLLTNKMAIDQYLPAYGEFGGDWYEYEGSYWKPDPSKPKQGIDWASAKEQRGDYAFHLTLGHHGLFSLTPVFVLALGGIGFAAFRFMQSIRLYGGLTWVSLLTLCVTLVVLAFYIFYVPDRSRNYGGWACGARWLLWLTPLLILSAVPAADWLGLRRWGRGLGYILLAVSVFSASYPAWNPWRHPWLYNLLTEMKLLDY
ncbi:MAG: hypothetical protein ACJ8FY_22255 [Gemmataceae bacterium]